ncbi:MAG TPA: hypothetical protein ENK54_03080 [Thiotrichales bacterium]|nr:hypothetical protein [Thiotrichales bacterium]
MMRPLSLFLLLLVVMTEATASQRIRLDGEGTPTARIAAGEPSILSVEGGRITKVWVSAAKATVKADEDSGQVILQPVGLGKTQPFSVIVKDDHGRVHTVVLRPARIPGETIVLVPRRQRDMRARRRAIDWEASQPYERTLVELIRRMALGRLPEGYEAVPMRRAVPLWEESEMHLVTRYLGGYLSGEVYRLRNVSEAEMRLAEREFYREGVLAVAITRPVLQPGEETEIYLVVEGATHE